MVKKIIISTLLILGTLQASETKKAETALHVEKSYLKALKKADKEKKPVMFIVSRHTCKYCIILEKEVLENKTIIEELNKNFVSAIAYTDDNARFPSKYNMGVTPTIWFLAEDGEPLFQPVRGALELRDFQRAISEVKKEYALVLKEKTKVKK